MTQQIYRCVFLVVALAASASLATASQSYTVTSSSDDGSAGTLRWAILQSEQDGTDSMITVNVTSVNLGADLPQVKAGQLSIEGNHVVIAANGTAGLTVKSSNVVVRHLTLDNARYGLQLVGATACTLSSVVVSNNSGNAAGLTLSGSNNNRVEYCTLRGHNAQGVLLVGGSSNNTLGPKNLIDRNQTGVVLTDGCTYNQISDSDITDSADSGVVLVKSSTNNVIGPANRFRTSGTSSIVVSSSNNQITANDIKESGTFGVYADSYGADVLIDGNNIDTCGFAGVMAQGTQRPTVSRNTIIACTNHYGVYFSNVSGGTVGPTNAIALCGFGGIYLENSDPCTVAGNQAIVLNFGPGLVIGSTKPRSNQAEILVEANAFMLNASGINLSWGAGHVRARLNQVFANVGSGIEVLGDGSRDDTQLFHTIEGNLVSSNGYSGISSYFASGLTLSANVFERSEGPGIDIQHGGVTDVIQSNLCRNNGVGIALILARNTLIEDNEITDNETFGVSYGIEPNVIRNNQIRGNGAAGLGSIFNNCASTIVNNTVIQNGVGINASGTGFNNIFYYNAIADAAFVTGLNLDFSDIGTFLGGSPTSKSNFSAVPLFRDYNGGDFHLGDKSPCRNRGYNGAPSLGSWDFDASPFTQGDPRILESTVDVGADESGGSYLTGGNGLGNIARVGGVRGFSSRDLPSLTTSTNLVRKLHRDGRWGARGGTHTYQVANLNDTGPGSLREAMTFANSDQGPSVIEFATGLRGTIWMNYLLPPMVDLFGATDVEGPVESDGVTPKIKLACATGVFSSAMVILTSKNIVRNFEIDVSVDAVQLYGMATQNLIENVRVRNTEDGLGFALVGADKNVLRRCYAGNNKLPGYYTWFAANDNLFEDCIAENHQSGPGMAFVAASGNKIYGTAPGASRYAGNITGVAILAGSQSNVLGPFVRVVDNGWSVAAGAGISIQGAGTNANVVAGVEIANTNGSAVQINNFAGETTIANTTVTDSMGSAVALTNAPDTIIDGCTFTGRAGQSDSIVSSFSWSPNLRVSGNTIKANSAANGVFLDSAAGAVVVGNHIEGSFAKYGSGILIYDGSDGCVIQTNVIGTSSGSSPDYGINLRSTVGSVVMQNVIHVGNSNGQARDNGIIAGETANYCVIGPDNAIYGDIATGDSTGIAVSGSDLGPDGLKIAQNKLIGQNGLATGILAVNLGSELVIDANDISGCTDFGMHLGPISTTRVVNNVIHDSPNAVGIQLPWDCGGSQPQVLFNTVVCNDVPISGDGRVWYNIFWSNDALASFNKAKADVHCNDVQGRASLGLPSDNAEVDPMFVKSGCGGGGDYHLSSGSPLIDFTCNAGKAPPGRPNHDIDSDARPRRNDYDVGQDERP